MTDVPSELREIVIVRAKDRCEYCQLSQLGQEATFHIDHVHPRNLGGPTNLSNLALACVSCSLRKWARVSAADPETGAIVSLFNPCTQDWCEHFSWSDAILLPLSASGRATVEALAMNRPIILSIREEEMVRGRHPPDQDSTIL